MIVSPMVWIFFDKLYVYISIRLDSCYYSKMGHQTSGINRIQQLSQSLTLVRQCPGEKVYLNRANDKEYLLITRLAQGNDNLEDTLAKRREIKCNYVPQLIEFGREKQGYCSDIAVINILFGHPAKTLAEQQIHRESVEEGFEEGEILMIAYCVLTALQQYSNLMGEHYEVSVSQETILIDMEGSIVLTDAHKYRENPSRRSLRRLHSEQGKFLVRVAIMQLGSILDRMIRQDRTKQTYTHSVRQFVQLLRTGGFEQYRQAIKYLEMMKNLQRSSSSKRNPNTLDQTPQSLGVMLQQGTPIGELVRLIESRQPLRQISESNHASLGIKSVCYQAGRKKENKCQIFKSKFQACKAQAFSQDQHPQQSTIRLDQISSIQQRHTLEDQPENNHHQNILPEGLVCYQSMQIPQISITKIELFSSGRPQRLKQLVLNQKGIIYQQSADEISSLASQRTHRMRNPSFHNE